MHTHHSLAYGSVWPSTARQTVEEDTNFCPYDEYRPYETERGGEHVRGDPTCEHPAFAGENHLLQWGFKIEREAFAGYNAGQGKRLTDTTSTRSETPRCRRRKHDLCSTTGAVLFGIVCVILGTPT
jgi:hypothetical protein